MSVQHLEAPASAHEVLKRSLPDLLNSSAVNTHLFKDNVSTDLEYNKTFPVYSIDINSIYDGRLVDDLTLIGWRHMLFDGDQAVAYVDLDAEASQIISITQGKFVQLTLEGVEAAENLEETSGTDYLVSYIEIRSIYFAALWLHNDDAGDLIMPLESHAHGEVSAMTAYSEADMLALLHQKRPFPSLNE